MNLTKRILTAALAISTTVGVLPASAAQAATSVSISYRDYDGRYGRDHRDYRRDGYRDHRRDYRRDGRRNWDRDRDGIPNRYDRYDNRRYSWNGGYGYRDHRRCWTEWQWSRWRGERVPVRVCR
jgi:hypothetical protein